jgi:lipoprotein-anchoring transpeptidase ErfK/SrfK
VDKPNIARSTRVAILLTTAVALLLSACSSSGSPTAGAGSGSKVVGGTSTGAGASTPATTSTSAATPTKPATPPKVVRVTSLESDGDTYGVGMPIVMYFKPVPKDVKAFEAAVKVTVNGKAANGAWYWEQPLKSEKDAHMVEAHYRLQNYWPADSKIHVGIPIGGLSAGKNLVYAKALTSLDYRIGDAHVSTVYNSSHKMLVTSNGKLVKTLPVSLGTATTPTYRGVKVVMQKGENIPGSSSLRPNGTVMMNGPGYSNDPVMWSVRVTQSGEYVHAAPWNGEVGAMNESNGCTNLHTADGKWFYQFAQIGDVVKYGDASGPLMRADDGLGDWNLTWGAWRAGGMFSAS